MVARLKAAGAVILGKVKLTEGAFSNHHPDVEPPVNPWVAERWTGVSSSGSGVSVAAGLAYGALGSDTGGSIRFPSACCGLVGIKPTYGRVSRHGAFPLAESLDHIGPMTRTVEDAARMLGVMAGQDPKDPTSLPAAVPNYVAETGGGIAGFAVGVDRDYIGEGVAPETVDVVEDALRLLESAGARVVDVRNARLCRSRGGVGDYVRSGMHARARGDLAFARRRLRSPTWHGCWRLGRRRPPRTTRAWSGRGSASAPNSTRPSPKCRPSRHRA